MSTQRVAIHGHGKAMAIALALVCAGCGNAEGIRQSVGLSVPPPDEFLVVAREPLQMPPSLDLLPPPEPGATSRVEPDARARARQALAGEQAAQAGPAGQATAPPTATGRLQPSVSEMALVATAGTGTPAIRETLRAEAAAGPATRRFGLDSFLGFQIVQDPTATADVVDPRAEAERLSTEGFAVPTTPPADPAPN